MTKYNTVDRISNLPDEIIHKILSLLPLKEAMATSVLSRRWSSLWTFISNLEFDPGSTWHGFMLCTPEIKHQKSSRFVDLVDGVLQQHKASVIKKFTISFGQNTQIFSSSIDKWVQFSMEKKVEELVLDFFGEESPYVFPHKLLGIGIASDPKHHIGFKYLKVLYFEEIEVNDEVVDYFLSQCPVLEQLSVSLAYNLFNVRVVGPSIRLKYLSIRTCTNLESIKICDTNLVSFIYEGHWVDTLVNNVPFLVEASITNSIAPCPTSQALNLAFSKLSCCLSQLQTLRVYLEGKHYNEDYVFPVLPNLKQLELEVYPEYEWCLSQLSAFMKATPSLQRLVLKLDVLPTYEERKIKKGGKCPHHNLKVLEVRGYRGRTNVYEHIRHVIENAARLEKIVIDVEVWNFPPSGAFRSKKIAKWETKARYDALHRLKKRVPSRIQIVCL